METTHVAPPVATDTDTATYGKNGMVQYPAPISAEEREAMLQSLITSWAIEGIHVPHEVAENALDAALRKPLPTIGER